MKKVITLYCVLNMITISLCFAQLNFRKGYIITVQKDTVHGEIAYRPNPLQYKSCVFKGHSGQSEYSPSELLGYGFVNDKFFKAQIVEDAFAEALVQGALSLYKHATFFYIQKADGEIHQLKNEQRKIESDGKVLMGDETRWKGILSFLVSDCYPDLEPIKRIKFGEKDLSMLVINYNKCMGATFIDYKQQKAWTKLGVGISAGFTRTSIRNLNADRPVFLEDAYHSVDPTIGIALSVHSPRLSERLALQAEMFYTKADFSSFMVRVRHPENIYINTNYYDANIGLTTVSLPISLKYTFPGNKYDVFGQLGLNFENHLRTSSRLLSENESYGIVQSYELPPLQLKDRQFGYWAGFGLEKPFFGCKGVVTLRYFYMPHFNYTLAKPAHIDKFSLTLSIYK